MRQLKENNAMQDDLIQCVGLLGSGLVVFASYSGLKQWHMIISGVGLIVALTMLPLLIWQMRRNKHMTPEDRRELARAEKDERSQMLQSMASRRCWEGESILLWIALVVFSFRRQMDIFCVSYMALIVRAVARIAVRWWLDRKY